MPCQLSKIHRSGGSNSGGRLSRGRSDCNWVRRDPGLDFDPFGRKSGLRMILATAFPLQPADSSHACSVARRSAFWNDSVAGVSDACEFVFAVRSE